MPSTRMSSPRGLSRRGVRRHACLGATTAATASSRRRRRPPPAGALCRSSDWEPSVWRRRAQPSNMPVPLAGGPQGTSTLRSRCARSRRRSLCPPSGRRASVRRPRSRVPDPSGEELQEPLHRRRPRVDDHLRQDDLSSPARRDRRLRGRPGGDGTRPASAGSPGPASWGNARCPRRRAGGGGASGTEARRGHGACGAARRKWGTPGPAAGPGGREPRATAPR